MAKTIQQMLNEVNYDFSNYQPSVKALMFAQFIKEVHGGELENKTPMIHMKMADLLFNGHLKRKAIMCARGHAKSSIIEYALLYGACFNEVLGLQNVDFVMYLADSMQNGAKILRKGIEGKYAYSDFLQKMIPNKKYTATDTTSKFPMPLSEYDVEDLHNAGRNITDTMIEFVNVNGNRYCIKMYGVLTGIRGTRMYNHRPQACFIDDIMTDEDSKSDTVISKIEDVIYNAVSHALHPTKRCMLWVGTPFNSKDPLYKAIESGTWASLVFPIAERFPVDKDKYKGAWEDRFPYEEVLEQYETSKLRDGGKSFNQELMLQIIPEEGLLVPMDNIVVIPTDTFRSKSKKYYNFYITTDFAYSDRQSADYSVITVWAVNSHHDFIVCDSFIGKTPIDKTMDILFSMCHKYKPLSVGIEVSGQQMGFVKIIYNEQVKRNIYFSITEIRPKKDKFSRFNMFTPILNQKKVMILSHIMESQWGEEFKDELSKATIEGFKSKHDDVLDTFSQLSEIQTFAPSNPEPDSTMYMTPRDKIFFNDSIKKKEKKNSIIF